MKGQQFMEYVSEQWQLYHLEEKQEQHLKKSQQMEMLYSSTPQTPIKQCMLSPHTPAKVSKLHGTSSISATPNSIICSAFGAAITHSPTAQLPPSGKKFGQARASTHMAAKPHVGHQTVGASGDSGREISGSSPGPLGVPLFAVAQPISS